MWFWCVVICVCVFLFVCLFYADLKTGGSTHAEGTVKGTDSVQSIGRRTGESLECSQMEKIRGDVSAFKFPKSVLPNQRHSTKHYFVYCYANYVEGRQTEISIVLVEWLLLNGFSAQCNQCYFCVTFSMKSCRGVCKEPVKC